jgi:phage gp16-like protein
MINNIDDAASYATEDNLVRALTKLGLNEFTYLVVCNRKGRFTAIFYRALSEFQGDVARAARHGFKTLG